MRKSLAEIGAFAVAARILWEGGEEEERAKMRTVVSCPFMSPENSESCDWDLSVSLLGQSAYCVQQIDAAIADLFKVYCIEKSTSF